MQEPTDWKEPSKVINPLSRTWCVGNLMRMFSAFNYPPKSQSPSRIKSYFQESSDVIAPLAAGRFFFFFKSKSTTFKWDLLLFPFAKHNNASNQIQLVSQESAGRCVATPLVICSHIQYSSGHVQLAAHSLFSFCLGALRLHEFYSSYIRHADTAAWKNTISTLYCCHKMSFSFLEFRKWMYEYECRIRINPL